MKRKEIQQIAKKIAKLELILQSSTDMTERQRAEMEIVKLSSGIRSLEDMEAIDEAVQDILAKNS